MDFQAILTALVKEVPSLSCFLLIVWLFLKHMKSRDSTMEILARGCNKVQDRATEAINKNSQMLGEVHTLLRRTNGNH